MGSIAPDVIDDQVKNNKNLKWVHSISAGVDGYLKNDSFRYIDIPLSNAKGAYSDVLGEFVALGVLYHTKHVERFV
jgi:phosphoglycerate dehydrogenase-like enzyme